MPRPDLVHYPNEEWFRVKFAVALLVAFILFVTAAVTWGQPLEDPNAWVIRVPIQATGHDKPAEHPATFQSEDECLEFLGSDDFAEDFDMYRLYEHTQHGDRVKFGVPKCELRGAGGDPA